ncbi:MAG: H-NS histone family protein [Paraburkholderia tropica]|uniref:H-NS histone family protein n=1 Tax=Burkholderia gladioli TaxID=28095 RepID=UPI00068E070C|nr:H-NS histone family protein [Burkholderia gladioli]AYQ91791.1 H-NS histone family protein [Burkholderia gladioli]
MNQFEEKGDAKSEYLDLIRQQRQLDEKVAHARDLVLADVVKSIVRVMLEYGVEVEDVRKAFPRSKGLSRTGVKRPRVKHVAKYLDAESGRTWSGRGRMPKWLEGKCLDDYLLKP